MLVPKLLTTLRGYTREQFYADVIYNPDLAVPEATIKEQGFGEMAKAG